MSAGWTLTENTFGRFPANANCGGFGLCYWCGNRAMIVMHGQPVTDGKTTLGNAVQRLANGTRKDSGLVSEGWRFDAVAVYPEIERLDVPDHLPASILPILEEGDIAYRGEHWRSAVACYGTVIDIAAADFITDSKTPASKLTLGQKLGALRKQNDIPEALVGFMEAVNMDRIASVHYGEPVTITAARAARSVTVALLEYLYSLPLAIEEARERLDKAKEG